MTATAQHPERPALSRPAAAATKAGPRLAPVKGHLDQVDLFRVLTFASVVAVHTTGATNPTVSTTSSGFQMLLHFTREAFFFLTGFVLVHSQGARPLRVVSFWKKRFRLIGVPYLVWTVIFVLYVQVRYGGPWNVIPKTLALDAVSGRGYYQLYFLLVSMQAYLVFPILLWVLNRTRRHPWLLLAGATVFELAETLYLHHHVPPPSGALHWYADWAYTLFPSYLVYIVAGALVARNLAACQTWLLTHRGLVLAFGLTSGVITEGWYLLAVHNGLPSTDDAFSASTVLQPVMVLWSAGAIGLLALISCSWAARRRPAGRFYRSLMWASSASFGVYLVHPLVLDFLIAHGFSGPTPTAVPLPWASLVAWALTLGGAVLLVAVFRRTPLSLPLTGRSRPGSGATDGRKSPAPAPAPPETALEPA